VVVALFAVLFTYMAFNVADQVLMSTGLHGAFGWNARVVAAVTAVLAALLAIFGYDWVHRVFRFLLVISFPCYGAWGWRGLTAYFAGFAAEIPFMVLPPIAGLSYTGYFPSHLTNGVDYAWLVGLAVSGSCTCCCHAHSTWPPSSQPSTPASGN
jgi:purine-cytosine permease-like protein